MIVGVAGVIFCLVHKEAPYAFGGFFASFLALFVVTGIGNGSTFQMIPTAFQDHHLRSADGGAPAREAAIGVARVETAAALGFISAIGAYGGWLIPQGFGVSTSLTGGPVGALYVLVAFYVTCLALTWRHAPRRDSSMDLSPDLAQADLESIS